MLTLEKLSDKKDGKKHSKVCPNSTHFHKTRAPTFQLTVKQPTKCASYLAV